MGERVRFSPAPSGSLHLGGAHTALFNHFVAQRGAGRFVLRFEDTDVACSDASFEEPIAQDLRWLGITWHEGPDIGGPHAPYRQSQRGPLYNEALRRLVDAGLVYPCFCRPEELEAERSRDAAEGRAPRYPGTCRVLERSEAEARAGAGEAHCWRFAVDAGREIVVRDEVHGEVRASCAGIGDFVVARAGGAAVYDLACVVDDAAMGITLVIRGDDHLSNTPRQILLFEALGFAPPRYAHVPLLRGADGRPLSKSRGAEPVRALREAGYLPEAVVNHLALLGWSDPDGREVLSPDEVVQAFDLARVSPAAPSHDPARLRWLNGRHMERLSPGERAAVIAPHIPALPGCTTAEAAELLAGEVEVAGDVVGLLGGVTTSLVPDAEAAAALGADAARPAIEVAAEALRSGAGADRLRDALRAAGLPAREAMPAVRAAITGRAHGLPVAVLVRLVGVEECVRRLAAWQGA